MVLAALARFLGSEAEPRHRALRDRQVQCAGGKAERHADPPHRIVGAEQIVEIAAHPRAEEAADLMAEEDDAVEHREIAYAENAPHDPAGERHGAQPEEAHRACEHQRAGMAQWQE